MLRNQMGHPNHLGVDIPLDLSGPVRPSGDADGDAMEGTEDATSKRKADVLDE